MSKKATEIMNLITPVSTRKIRDVSICPSSCGFTEDRDSPRQSAMPGVSQPSPRGARIQPGPPRKGGADLVGQKARLDSGHGGLGLESPQRGLLAGA